MRRSGFLTLLATGSIFVAPAAGASGRPDMAMARIAPAAPTSVAKRSAGPFQQRITVEPPPIDRRIAVEQRYGSGAATGRIEARIRLHGSPFAARNSPANFRPRNAD